MIEQNHTSRIEHDLDGLKDGLEKLVHRFGTTPEGYLGKAVQRIKDKPLTAVAIAFGLGYLVVRLARRR